MNTSGNFNSRRFVTQTIQFTGNSQVRTAPEQSVQLMSVHGFRFNTSANVNGAWVMEYTRIVNSFEAVSSKFMEKLGAQFSVINNKDSVLLNHDVKFTGQSAGL